MYIITHMSKYINKMDRILKLARKSKILTAAEVRSHGIHHEYLRQMCAEGMLVRDGRGVYSLPDQDITVHHGLALAAKAVPKGVICLLSALRFHEIGTQAPHEIWMAIDRRSAQPRVKHLKMRIVRFSGASLTEGIERHSIEGVDIAFYNPAKTIADSFKYRNKIGIDVALEGLREVLNGRRCTVDDLWKYAKICRVSNVIRPYMEAIL